VCTEVDEGGDRHDHLHVMGDIDEVAEHVVRGEEEVGVATTEIMVLGRPTASMQAKIVSEVLLIVIFRETMEGQIVICDCIILISKCFQTHSAFYTCIF